MASALVVGGTGFVGRHAVADLLEHGYDVTAFSRRRRDSSDSWDAVTHVEVDRTDAEAFRAAVHRTDPDVVLDCALFHPDHARSAVETFADVDAYVYVSSGGVYARDDVPKRESVTPLHSFSSDHADDDTMASYGPRKAECDRIVTRAAEDGVAATSVRPTMVYGPKSLDGLAGSASGSVSWAPDRPGIQNHHEYWIHRVDEYDRVVVPGDGTAIWHRVYVEDVASALRIVAEEGAPGEAYNVADRLVLTMEDVVALVAETLDTSVEVVHASRRELEAVGLTPDDFVLYHHLGRNYPHVLSTCKLAALGWDSTPVEVAMERTVEDALASDRDGKAFDPGRAAEERFLDSIAE
ncbi:MULTISPECIES: NAD-dependent epimerase/dehydratase family protein [Haloarcula]|uniref:Epimerase n=1 Tax=Haloarcula pellucida TaxID=1427151 RepID=A0A830GK24_9EURY|nr:MULTISPECIES: NAD-dependent epimerase/dehydratase family protein [Halomicroarcula]MBX0349749.1 NAD-dependent epimerase/dehydratase family protein [Halomicroarcula pellucida]MDS0279897.1 NAD-dependent epimerase/dehydratase family protein [Halomicroarcula sp. S1AR25-4]GGN94123.1 epimerase [Halomicroarcula pellucida]